MTLGWVEVSIGDLCEVGRGSSPRPIADQKYFQGGTIPWVKIADATASTRYIFETRQHVNDYGASFSRKLPANSIILAASGTLGFPMYLGVEACIHDGWLYFTNFKLNEIDPDYFYYSLITLRSYFEKMSSGAAIQNINTEILRTAKIWKPDIQRQKNISALLRAYDDLIEANLKRIKLLEEMAKITYEEWFVRLHFPGFETTPISPENGLPARWEKTRLSELLILQRGFDLPTIDRVEGVTPIYSSTGVTGSHHHSKVKAPGVITGRSGSLGKVMYARDDFWPLNTTLWVKELKGITMAFAFFLLGDLELEKYNSGVAVPTLNRNDVQLVIVNKPPSELVDKFTEFVLPIFDTIDDLRGQNIHLKEARDILLPRLMTGLIDIDDYRPRNASPAVAV